MDSQTSYKNLFFGFSCFSGSSSNYFFGRDEEIETVIDTFQCFPLVVLYGERSVGKSSILRAGVIPKLEEYEKQKTAVLIYPSDEDLKNNKVNWKDSSVILKNLLDQIKKLIEKHNPTLEESTIKKIMKILGHTWEDYDTKAFDKPSFFITLLEVYTAILNQLGIYRLYIILDQFDDYLLANPTSFGSQRNFTEFDKTFIKAVNSRKLPINWLISLQTDWLAKLDRYKGYILNIFDTRLELGCLDKNSGIEAIVKPIFHYFREQNKKEFELSMFAFSRGAEILGLLLLQIMILQENQLQELAENILEDIKTFEDKPKDNNQNKSQFQALLLQLDLKILWDELFKEKGSSENFIIEPLEAIEFLGKKFKELERTEGVINKCLKNQIQGIANLEKVKNLISKKSKKDDKDDKIPEYLQDNYHEYIVAILFHYLVTSQGRLIPYNSRELTDAYNSYAHQYGLPKLNLEEIQAILNKLSNSDIRILRRLSNEQYEIFHPCLGKVITNWATEKLGELKRQTTEKNLIVIQTLTKQAIDPEQFEPSPLRIAYHAYYLYKEKYDSPTVLLPSVDQALRIALKFKAGKEKIESLSSLEVQEEQITCLACNKTWVVSGSNRGIVRIWGWNNDKKYILDTNNWDGLSPLTKENYQKISALALDKHNHLAISIAQVKQSNRFDKSILYRAILFAQLDETNNFDLLERSLTVLYENKNLYDDDWISSLAFNSRGTLLASGSRDKTIKVWDVQSPKPTLIEKFKQHTDYEDWIWSVTFYPHPTKNSEIIAAGCRNGTVLLGQLTKYNGEWTTDGKLQELPVHVQNDWQCCSPELTRDREIFTAVFSTDGKSLAAAGRDGIIYLWDVSNLHELWNDNKNENQFLDQVKSSRRQLLGHQNTVKCLAFYPNTYQTEPYKKQRQWLLSASNHGTVRLWKYNRIPSSLTILDTEGGDGSQGISGLVIHPKDNKMVFSRWYGKVTLATEKEDLESHVTVLSGEHKGVIKSLVFLDNNYLVSTSYDTQAIIWKFEKKEKVFDLFNGKNMGKKGKELRTVAYNPSTNSLAVAGLDGIITLWQFTNSNFENPSSPNYIKPDELNDIHSLVYSDDGRWLAIGRAGIKEKEQPSKLLLYDTQKKELKELKLSECGKNEPRTPEDEGKIRTVTFYHDTISNTQWLVAGGDHAIIRLWKLPENATEWTEEKAIIKFQEKQNPINGAITQIALSCDKDNNIWLAITTEKENIYVWKLHCSNDNNVSNILIKGKLFIPKGGKGSTLTIHSNYLATGGRLGTIYLWKLNALNAPPILLQGHKHNIRALAFSQPKNDPEKLYLASASDDKTIRVWTVETERVRGKVAKRINPKNDLGLTKEEWEGIFGDSILYEPCPN